MCNSVLGKIDYEKEGTKNERDRLDSSDLSEQEHEGKPEFSQEFYEYLKPDGDIASTDDSDSEDEEKSKLPDNQVSHENSESEASENLPVPEAQVIRSNILKFMSLQNKKGNTLLHEAILEDRETLLLTLRAVQLIKQDLKNYKGMTWREYRDYLTVNEFLRRYQDITNQINHKKHKRR